MLKIKRILQAIKNKYNSIVNPKTELDRLIENGLKVGKNFNMFNAEIDYGHCWLIEIGDDVMITNSTILAHDASMKNDLGVSKVGKVKIGNRVFIGYGSIVLCNTKIGDDVVIGAGSVVTRDIPSNSIAVGNPAVVVGTKSDFIDKHRNNLKNKPVFDTYWPYKTQEQKKIMNEELEMGFGYDL